MKETKKTTFDLTVKNAVIFLIMMIFISPLFSKPVFADEEEPIELEVETTVTATPLEKFLVTTGVIKKEDIEKSPARDVSDLLRDVNGVISLGPANKKAKADIGIRGFGMNYIRVFIDGVPLNTANDRTVDFTLIPKEIIERIEVIKGPAPVTYGSDSMGGIINIVTKSGRDNKAVYAKATGGGYGTAEGSVIAGGGKKNFGYFVMAKSRKMDGYRDHTADNFTDIFLKADYDFTKDTNMMFLFMNTNGDREAPNGVNPDGTMRKQTQGFWSGSYNWEYQDIVQQMFNLKLEKKADKKIGYRVNVFYKKYDDALRAWVDEGTPIKPPAGSPFQYYRAGAWNYSYWESYIYGGDFRVVVPAGKHKITAGYALERSSFKDTYSGRSSQNDPEGSYSLPQEEWNRDYMNPWTDLNYNSVYVQDEVALNPSLILTVGLRSDSYSKSDSSLNGIANLVYTKGKNTWRATVGKTGRFPTLKELEGRGGNPDLKPEAAWNYEIGFRHREPKNLDFEAAVYYSSINNLIQPVDPTDGFSIKENVSNVKIFGGEANVIKSWGNLQGRLGYTYIHRTSPPLTSDWEEVPMHKGLAELRWDKEDSLCWGIQGVFMGSKKTGDADIDRIPGYAIANLVLSYPSFKTLDKQGKPYQVELKVTNLFDKEYQNRLYYPAPGRWVTGSLKYRF